MTTTAAISTEQQTEHPHIVQVPGICDGRPTLKGTRISVCHLAQLYKAGNTVEEILQTYSYLPAAAVYDAISYYLDHQEEIEQEIADHRIEAENKRHDLAPMRREPNYLYLMIGLLSAVVLATAASPMSPLARLGGFLAVLSLLLTAYFLNPHRGQLLLALLLGAAAFIPFTWLSTHPDVLNPRLVNGIYVLTLVLWVLFILYIGRIVFRGILTARHIRGNEIYGAIYVYLLIGLVFAALYQLLLAWQPDALYFDPGRFQEPSVITGELSTRGVGAVLYYSFVTLGTVGYGDVTPASPLARAVSLIEAIIGIMYVATLIARFVSIQISNEGHSAKSERAAPPQRAVAERLKDNQ